MVARIRRNLRVSASLGPLSRSSAQNRRRLDPSGRLRAAELLAAEGGYVRQNLLGDVTDAQPDELMDHELNEDAGLLDAYLEADTGTSER